MAKVIKLGQYKDIEVTVEKHTVTDLEVQNQINTVVAQNHSLSKKENDVVENGDVTTIDFKGMKDGVAFDGGTAQGYQLEIGSGAFIPGFEEQMIGMKKGETRNLNLTFPENYGAADLAGADVIFEVTVHNIQVKKAAELNDEFVKTLNIPEVNTVDDFNQFMRTQLEMQVQQQYNQMVENAVMDKLIKDSEVEVEDEDINKALQQHVQRISMELAQQGMALDQYLAMMGMNEEVLREQLKPTAAQQAQFEAIIDEVANVESLNTSDEELNEQVEKIAEYNQVSKEMVLEKVNLEDLRHDFNRVKASSLIINSAIVK